MNPDLNPAHEPAPGRPLDADEDLASTGRWPGSGDAVASPAAWWFGVGSYGFLVSAAEVDAVDLGLQTCALPHAPAWVAGMAHARGRVCGVVDFGRFLGVSTSRTGPLVWPRAEISPAWALRVHEVQALDEAEWAAAQAGLDIPPATSTRPGLPLPPAGDRPAATPALGPEWTQRPRPGFVTGRSRWVSPTGVRRVADLLSLAAWAVHPRLTEHGG